MIRVKDYLRKPKLVLYNDQPLLETAQALSTMSDHQIPVVDRSYKYVGMLKKDKVLAIIVNPVSKEMIVEEGLDRTIRTLSIDEEVPLLSIKGEELLPVCDNDGLLLGVCCGKEINHRLLVEREQLREEIMTLLQASTDAIVVVDKEGYVTGFNQVAEKIVGISREQAMGKWVGEVIPETGLPEVLKTGQHQFSQRLTINGITAVSNRSPIIYEGEVIGAFGMFQDMSELENVSRKLKETEELKTELDAIIESSYDGIYVTDGEGKTLRVNSAYERITGVQAQEVTGVTMDELVKRGYYSDSVTLHVLKKRVPTTIMQTIRSGVEVIVTGNPIFNEDGEIIRVVTNVRDITELNSLKEQLEETKMLSERYHLELEQLRMQQLQYGDVVARSPEMQKVLDLVARVATVNSTVLITGESGVGKEVILKMIHRMSNRKDGPLIKINCGAIPENLLESELFGYSEGAFTGARKTGKPGMVELADKGTLFLDEIGEMPLGLQVKLLRALQEHEITRIGGTKPVNVDVRFIAATNRELEKQVEQGQFREDLYYRLNVINIKIPALRNRSADIPPLIMLFLNKFNREHKRNKKISTEAIESLTSYDWPGNVRELENMIERLVIMVDEKTIEHHHLSDYIRSRGDEGDFRVAFSRLVPLKQAVGQVEKSLISSALAECKNMEEAAKLLGVDRTTILRKVQKYRIK